MILTAAMPFSFITFGNFSLGKLQAEQTIIVFWASWCGYCEKALPQIEQYASLHPQTKVVAISLDTIADDFEKAKAKYPHMIHYSDLKGWNSEYARIYNINATPTFYLLDSDKKIQGRFADGSQILKMLPE